MSDSILDDILAQAEMLSVTDVSPPSSPGVARTPSVRVSPRRGGLGMRSEGKVTFQLFSVLDIDCSDMTYCFGVIGNGSSFCIKRGCTTGTHASNKMSFAGSHDSFVFIRRNIPGSVFSEPKLLSSKLPDDVMEDWTSKRLTSDDWSNEFQAIDGIIEPLTSVEEIQTESEFLVESTLMRTPAKRKKDSFAGEEYEGNPYPAWKNRKYERSFPHDSQDLEALISSGVKKGIVTTAVANIETYIEDLSDALVD